MRRRLSILPWAFAALAAAASLASAEQGIPGQVLLSDGTSAEGEVFTRGEMPVRVYALDSKQVRKVLLPDVLRISVRVAKAELVKEFEWVEMGSDEKIFTGKTFPRKDFEADVELRSGEVVSGHLLAVVYVREGEEIRKFELLRYQRGETGQSLESLVHVKEIAFP
ncbi:MAG: hypothetical protein MUC63_04065, partial [Planctomycetes bacterium]|nr:hypothetical protein [Planctomycetota bacterium]